VIHDTQQHIQLVPCLLKRTPKRPRLPTVTVVGQPRQEFFLLASELHLGVTLSENRMLLRNKIMQAMKERMAYVPAEGRVQVV